MLSKELIASKQEQGYMCSLPVVHGHYTLLCRLQGRGTKAQEGRGNAYSEGTAER